MDFTHENLKTWCSCFSFVFLEISFVYLKSKGETLILSYLQRFLCFWIQQAKTNGKMSSLKLFEQILDFWDGLMGHCPSIQLATSSIQLLAVTTASSSRHILGLMSPWGGALTPNSSYLYLVLLNLNTSRWSSCQHMKIWAPEIFANFRQDES